MCTEGEVHARKLRAHLTMGLRNRDAVKLTKIEASIDDELRTFCPDHMTELDRIRRMAADRADRMTREYLEWD